MPAELGESLHKHLAENDANLIDGWGTRFRIYIVIEPNSAQAAQILIRSAGANRRFEDESIASDDFCRFVSLRDSRPIGILNSKP